MVDIIGITLSLCFLAGAYLVLAAAVRPLGPR